MVACAVEQKTKRQVANFNTVWQPTRCDVDVDRDKCDTTPTSLISTSVIICDLLCCNLHLSFSLSLRESQYQFYSPFSWFLSTGCCYNEDFRVKLELLETMITFCSTKTFEYISLDL
uniref:Uncharacterized protein n=1 Tax=Lactuca sativa TaxID=4236 RepID=A0A9R1WTK3_LACSA|nr:hypothetical protein LSAT_V11C900493040 [Lactuca sativa]